MKKYFLLFLNLSILLFGCNIKKNYYYVEDSKEEKLIEASSDSSAYMEAYTKFQISKKVYRDMNQSMGTVTLSEPISFSLLDENRKDITFLISFSNKDSLEKFTENRINDLPNNIEESVKKGREERNGKGAKYDTLGLHLSPIKVISARFVEKEYSNYKDVSLRYKNVSNKKVSAIRFKWYGENAFNEPADLGGLYRNGWGGGFDDEGLSVGRTTSSVWNVLSKDGRKILIAYPYEVAFTDGTKWELKNN
jgi:hypothetical protein